MSLLCQLWSLNEAIQALKDQQQLMNNSSQISRQINSVSPVMEDTEDLMNDSPENSQDWDIEIEDSEMNGSEVSSTWKFSHSGVIPTGSFRQFQENSMVMERENADGGASNSLVQNDKEEDYYYTTPISAQLGQSDANVKTRSMGEGRSASSSPSVKNVQYSNLQNRVNQLQPENSRIDKVSLPSNRIKNSPESVKNKNYSDALESINQAQNDLKLLSPSILQRTQQQLNEQQQNISGRLGKNSKIINPLLAIHQEREKERQKERDRERYVIMRQSQRHSLQQNQSQTHAPDENIYENCGEKRNVIHGVHIPPF